jgi:hypothetical protein
MDWTFIFTVVVIAAVTMYFVNHVPQLKAFIG